MTTSHTTASSSGTPVAVAVVTGASRGIGAAIAHRLAADGFAVAVHYRRSDTAAALIVEKIAAAGGTAFSFAADLTAPDIGTAFWDAYDAAAGEHRHTPVQVLVNNAGVTLRGIIDDFSADDFLVQQQINTTAPFLITQAALPRVADGGRIVNISSGVTRIALPDVIGYAMTKGAIEAFTRTLAQHLGPRRITVNAVAPGVIDTDMNASWLRDNPGAIAATSAQIALGRIGGPDDVADVVGFLASSDARYITGQVLDATGGSRL
jgi:3-oxoacyl-[acyl-carrier protein] reductase